MAKKVGNSKKGQTAETQTVDDGKKKKKVRIDFPTASAKYVNEEGKTVKAADSNGLLLAVPRPIVDDNEKVVFAGYSVAKHKPLKKTAFASMATYLEYLGYVARQKAAKLIAIADDKEAKAERIRQFGDEETRKKAEKLLKLKDKYAALAAQLEADGVDVDALEQTKKEK